jgi:hypothetical protein
LGVGGSSAKKSSPSNPAGREFGRTHLKRSGRSLLSRREVEVGSTAIRFLLPFGEPLVIITLKKEGEKS